MAWHHHSSASCQSSMKLNFFMPTIVVMETQKPVTIRVVPPAFSLFDDKTNKQTNKIFLMSTIAVIAISAISTHPTLLPSQSYPFIPNLILSGPAIENEHTSISSNIYQTSGSASSCGWHRFFYYYYFIYLFILHRTAVGLAKYYSLISTIFLLFSSFQILMTNCFSLLTPIFVSRQPKLCLVS